MITQLKGFHLLLLVAFGAGHTTMTTLQQNIESMTAHMEMLYHYKPQAPDHELLGLALVTQQFRMHFNMWVSRRLASATPTPFPPSIHMVWDQILLSRCA
jgi:hypothetical protein